MTQICQRPIELLAPAKNREIAIEAIRHGADAVYIGASSHGARSAAANSIADLAAVAEYAHQYNARVYATVNTIIYDSELKEVERLIHDLYRVGVDALIVQDMAVLRLDIPPIALHASTQCDTRTPEKARFLQDVGFSQIVLPRELSLREIKAMHEAVDVPLESFIHGALCVSYSGDCQASCATNGRSANRGECAQICRLPFNLIDGNGQTVVRDKHLLSLRDLNRSRSLLAMLDAGVSSLKIEGRLKDMAYVKNTVAAYRRLLDDIFAAYPDKYRAASYGNVTTTFTPDLNKSFNRGFTDYFSLDSLASIDTPKWQGERVGKVRSNDGKRLTAILDETLHNGDGLTYLTPEGEFHGFRANRVEGNVISLTAKEQKLTPGTIIYRNRDKEWDDMLAGDTARREIAVDITLRATPAGAAVIDLSDHYGHSASVTADIIDGQARKPQEEVRRRALCKTGGTRFRVDRVNDTLGDSFVAISALTELRRQAIEALDRDYRATYRFDTRRSESDTAFPATSPLSYHDNVANRLAREFYEAHGAKVGQNALELGQPSATGEIRVMQSHYCIRRQMGKCLRTSQGNDWKEPLTLSSAGADYRLEFDCKNCRMNLYTSIKNASKKK